MSLQPKLSLPARLRCSLACLIVAAAGISATGHAASADPSASPAPKSATPNSFSEVTAQLDPGGDLYLYLSTEQWISRLDANLTTFRDLVLSSAPNQSAESREKMSKVLDLLINAVKKSGLDDLSGYGGSSIALEPGFFRNKIFLHHYSSAKSDGLLWTACGKDNHPFPELDLLPADTVHASFSTLDLNQIITTLRQEADQSGLPEFKQGLDQAASKFQVNTGLALDDVLGSLNGMIGTVLTLDATNTVAIPIGNRPETIPLPRIAIFIGVKNNLIFKQADARLSVSMPSADRVTEPNLEMRTVPIPTMPFRPTIAQWGNYFVICSDDRLIRNMQAAQNGGPALKPTPEFTHLSAGLPPTGTGFSLTMPRLMEVIQKVQADVTSSQPGQNPQSAENVRKLMTFFQKPASSYGVTTRLPNGFLTIAQGSQGPFQVLAPLFIVPVAFISAVTVPAIMKAQNSALQAKSGSNLKQLYVGCLSYAGDHDGKFPPNLNVLFPQYLSDRSILISPFAPQVQPGYVYTTDLNQLSPATMTLINDPFSEAKGEHVYITVDGRLHNTAWDSSHR